MGAVFLRLYPNPDKPVGVKRKSRFIGEPKKDQSRKHEMTKARKKTNKIFVFSNLRVFVMNTFFHKMFSTTEIVKSTATRDAAFQFPDFCPPTTLIGLVNIVELGMRILSPEELRVVYRRSICSTVPSKPPVMIWSPRRKGW